MTEQVYAVDMNLGWITITAEDASVPIDRSFITNAIYNDNAPAFYAKRGMTPTINALFGFTAGTQVVYGLYVDENARGIILAGGGFTNGTYGLMAINNSIVDARSANVRNSDYGMIAYNGSKVSASHADASHAKYYGFYAVNSSMIDAYYATATNCSGYAAGAGVYAQGGSTINAYGAVVNGSSYGILARESSVVAATYVQARNCAVRGMYALYGSTIDGQYSDSSGAGGSGGYDIALNYGCFITSVWATGDVIQTKNTMNINGVIFRQ